MKRRGAVAFARSAIGRTIVEYGAKRRRREGD
jgi:hypothetical protein